MNKAFRPLVKQIERYLASDNSLTADEKAVLSTLLSDFRESILEGRLDEYTKRKNLYRYEVFALVSRGDHLIYSSFKRFSSNVRTLEYKLDGESFARIKDVLEQFGFEVQMSEYTAYRGASPLHAYYTVPSRRAS